MPNRTQTLTQTKTQTITTTKMLTATLALALANAAAFAVIPLQEKPIMNLGAACPVVSVEYRQSCGNGKYAEAEVLCGSEGSGSLVLQPYSCLSPVEMETQARLVCQKECLSNP